MVNHYFLIRGGDNAAPVLTNTKPTAENRVGTVTVPYAKPFRPVGSKLYERDRPKEIAAVVDEFKQHKENERKEENDDERYQRAIDTSSVRPSAWCPARRPSTQSKSFLMLQSMLDSGEEGLND